MLLSGPSYKSATENVSVGLALRLLDGAAEDHGAFTIPNSSQWFAETIAIRG